MTFSIYGIYTVYIPYIIYPFLIIDLNSPRFSQNHLKYINYSPLDGASRNLLYTPPCEAKPKYKVSFYKVIFAEKKSFLKFKFLKLF